MAKRDYYEILGVPKNAGKDQIKKAYRDLAKKYHPDVNKEKDAAERFKEVSEAYAVLSDDQKRATYDQFGHAGFDQRYSREDIFRDFDFDVFRDLGVDFGGFDSIFDVFFGRQREQHRGYDIRYDLKITLEEATEGIEKNIQVRRHEACRTCKGSGSKDGKIKECDECNGSGQVRRSSRALFGVFTQISSCGNCNGTGRIIQNPCRDCMGAGTEVNTADIKIKIPAGVDNGTQLRLSGQGERANGGTGDLYVSIHVLPHQIFERENEHLYCTRSISFSVACLGGEIEIPLLRGKTKLKIPAGTQPQTTFRLKGLGIKRLHGHGSGDLFVTVNIKIPEKLSKRQRDLLQEFEKE